MKALVLAGGHGARLRPITHTQPKQLIPVANKPVLFYGLEAIADAGIREVVVIVGDTGERIRDAVRDGSAWGLDVTYVRQHAPRGLAHAVLAARHHLEGGPFLMYLGDNLVREGLRPFVRTFEAHRPDAQILLAKVPDPERFGVAVVEADRVTRLVEKPKEHVSDMAVSGVYIFTAAICQAASSIPASWREELEITDAIQHLVDHGYSVRAELMSDWWKDTGTLEDLLEANRLVLDEQERRIEGDVDGGSRIVGDVRVATGAVVRDSVIRGPSIIASGCRIERSVIDPWTSVDAGTHVVNSEIGDSIVMGGCRIIGARIRKSLIGRNVRVHRAGPDPSVRLLVGDDCSVALS